MSSVSMLIACLLLFLACADALGADAGDAHKSGKVRFYTGNLSVGHFMEYWGTGAATGSRLATPEFCTQMKEVGVSAVCDYLGWCRIEASPGKWNWDIHDRNERVLRENGLQYNVFCWLHFPPKWFMKGPDYTPYRCLEHDEPVQQTSIWAPGTLSIYERFYRQLAKHFGDRIDFIRLATPAEYGEIGYPNGMTNWLVKQEHVHPGFWCGDHFARTDFRRKMEARYSTIEKLNSAWGTSFKSFAEIEYPAAVKDQAKLVEPLDMTPEERTWMLDFVGWYYDSQTDFTRKVIRIVRKHFPGKEIIVSMGYGSQHRFYGNDDVGVAKMCKEMNVACQTPGNIPYFSMKSLASPCRFYGVPYFTEPPGDMNPNQEVDRIWSDASCGSQTYFDYPQNLQKAKDVFVKYGHYLNGAKSIVDMAVFFPTAEHRLRNQDWPRKTMEGANHIREYLDYDLVDERMIQDGALSRYRLLVIFEERMIAEQSTLSSVEKWIQGGGVLVMADPDQIRTVAGDLWDEWQLETGLAHLQTPGFEGGFTKELGKGQIRIQREMKPHEFAAHVADIAHRLSQECPGLKDLPMIDGEADGVTATIFPDRILYLNPTDKTISKHIEFRESDFPRGGRTGRPQRWQESLVLEPHSIRQVELR